jgi:feruloyl esterase
MRPRGRVLAAAPWRRAAILIALRLCVPLGAAAHGTAPGRCAAMAGTRLSPARIGLPTRGAVVVQARFHPAVTSKEHPTPDYCQVVGAIHPIDPRAPDIRFELDLPTAWNGKALMLGGGGFDGFIPDTSGPLLGEPAAKAPPPLLRGYATFGGDSGHQASSRAVPIPAVDGAFATNDEALKNYAADALKKTHDAALALIVRRYRRAPAHTYFAGGSNGGREAFAAVQRWPRDFDGAIAAYPFWNAGTTALVFGVLSRALAAPGAYPDPAKRALVLRAAIARCDGLDGLKDGLIANVEACRFDPSMLRCPGGADGGDTCLSDAQIAALRTYASPFVFAFRPAGAERVYPGFTALSGAQIADPVVLGTAAPSFPPTLGMPLAAHFWDQFARFAIARDPNFNSLSLDPQRPGKYAARINEVVGMLDMTATDLSAFSARGGKLLVYHGLADPLVSHRSTELYWRRLQRTMGARTVASFARFYVVPGYGHGAGAFVPGWDPLSVLEAWRERGRAPGSLTATDANPAGKGRGRPLCLDGSWPAYDGRGDPDRAASFRCRPDGAHGG